MESFGSSRIAGIGAYLPKQRVTTDELMREVNSLRFNIPDNYISQHIGILEKRIADESMQPSDLAVLASEVALRDAGVSANEIDLIIYTGITRDFEEPSTAHFVQDKIGAHNAICMDVSNACLGFMSGLSLADSIISSGHGRNVLICTGEVQSRIMFDFLPFLIETDDLKEFKKKLGVLTVGDGGGAMVVQAKEEGNSGWHWFRTWSEGKHTKLCYYRKQVHGIEGQMIMDKICALTLKAHVNLMETTRERIEWCPDGVDKVYCHQVGAPPHQELLSRANLTDCNAPISYDKFGNLTSATIPILMTLFPPQQHEKLLFFCSGSGISVFQGGMIF